GIDISKGYPKPVDDFVNESFDYVITVCDGAREVCPVFTGNVKHRLHIDFEDPAGATGSEVEVLAVFRKIRDKIKTEFSSFYKKNILNNLPRMHE
ncbi:MAG TPA: arsenate reductase ArsC, partial [Bacteroidetes bacterium]|nr:arsenate reductase ArsC [Bacteroidota bacterium]